MLFGSTCYGSCGPRTWGHIDLKENAMVAVLQCLQKALVEGFWFCFGLLKASVAGAPVLLSWEELEGAS